MIGTTTAAIEQIKCKLLGHEWIYYGFRNSKTTGNSIFTYQCSKCKKQKEEIIY